MLISCRSRIISLLVLSFLALVPLEASVRIALLDLDRPLSLTVNIREGSYRILADGEYYYPAKGDNVLIVKADNKSSYKEVSIHERTVNVVANTYNYLDSDFDVLLPGCCAKSIKDRDEE